jgi:hypothetical protein
MANPATTFQSAIQAVAAVVGENTAQGDGVFGIGHGVTGRGVVGTSEQQNGVTGVASGSGGTGVWGVGQQGNGVFGESKTSSACGVVGQNLSGGGGILGVSKDGDAVFGRASGKGRGIVGTSDGHTAVEGNSVNGGAAIFGATDTGEGIHGETSSATMAAVAGYQLNTGGSGAAIYGKKSGTGGYAGFFDGDVHVTGTHTCDRDICCTNADCAEDFEIAAGSHIDPGTVVVLGDDECLHGSHSAYDNRVAGVISGAGNYRPAIVLDKRPDTSKRQPVALLGKVFCKVDASYAPIRVGDLLTTSDTPGHAMKAADPLRSFGTVLGKALRPLPHGRALIPILVTLQ